MLKVSDGKIGTREFAAILLFAIGLRSTDTTPDLLIFRGQNASWAVSLIAFLTILIPSFFLVALQKKYKQGLIELVFRFFGKGLGTVVAIGIFVIVFFSTTLNTRSYVDIVNTMYYSKTPIPFLYFLLILVCWFIAKRGFETIGRSAWMALWSTFLVQLFIVLAIQQDIRVDALYPIAGPGIDKLLVNGMTGSSIFGDCIILAACYSFVRNDESYRKGYWIGLITSCLLVTLMVALFTVVFDYPAVLHLNYPYHQMTRSASVGTFTHLESFFLGFWVVATSLHFSIYLYLTAFLFAKAFKMKEFEPLLLPISALVMFTGLLPENVTVLNQFREILIQASSYLLVGLPVLMWAMAFMKRRAKP